MRSTPLKSKADARHLHVVGTEFMVLDGKYPANQLWFDFMDRAVYEAVVQQVPEKYTRHNFPKRPFVPVSEFDRMLVQDDIGNGQLVLPFREAKRISHKRFSIMQKNRFKTWDKKPDGTLYEMTLRSDLKLAEVSAWCIENFVSRFHLRGQLMSFESAVDAVTAKLKFS